MGIRETLARCFGRRSRSTRAIGEEVSELIRKSEELFPPTNGLIDPAKWSRAILDSYKDHLSMGGFTVPEEKVCPLTKQIVLQELTELANNHEGLSIRQILNSAMANGVASDYELAERLRELAKQKLVAPRKLHPDAVIDQMYSAQHMASRVRIKLHDKMMDFLVDDWG